MKLEFLVAITVDDAIDNILFLPKPIDRNIIEKDLESLASLNVARVLETISSHDKTCQCNISPTHNFCTFSSVSCYFVRATCPSRRPRGR